MKIIVEGLWGLGKTTLCKNLIKSGFNYYPEPNIKDYKSGDLANWFFYKYKEILNTQLRDTNKSVAERSALSTLSYDISQGSNNKANCNFLNKYKKIDLIIFLKVTNMDNYMHKVINNHRMLLLKSDINFYSSYQEVLFNTIKKHNNNILIIDVLDNSFTKHTSIHKIVMSHLNLTM